MSAKFSHTGLVISWSAFSSMRKTFSCLRNTFFGTHFETFQFGLQYLSLSYHQFRDVDPLPRIKGRSRENIEAMEGEDYTILPCEIAKSENTWRHWYKDDERIDISNNKL